jgi:hypothetical protein
MLKKIGGLARALYILLAIVAGFVALGGMNVSLILVVLGLIAGLAMLRERMVLAGVLVLVLPAIGAALSALPAIGAQLAAVTGYLQLGAAASLATATAILLYELVIEGVMGFTGGAAAKPAAATN